MLSILLPIYNFNCLPLVTDLLQQCEAAQIIFEIIALEDASTQYLAQNSRIKKLSKHITYERLSQNIGRSSIRNLLAEKAKYEYLLFLDCDSAVVNNQYIQNYIKALNSNQLLYGGRVYRAQAPENKQLILHWKFGKYREQIPAIVRAKQPYHSFMTNNFVIPKTIFQQIQFNEKLTQYGHEDTLFGMELKNRQIPILHLDNSLEHIGLETTNVFLNKTKQALENLAILHQAGSRIDTKLLRVYQQLEHWKLKKIAQLILRVLRPILKRLLHLKNPSSFIFDLYKLDFFIEKSDLV